MHIHFSGMIKAGITDFSNVIPDPVSLHCLLSNVIFGDYRDLSISHKKVILGEINYSEDDIIRGVTNIQHFTILNYLSIDDFSYWGCMGTFS